MPRCSTPYTSTSSSGGLLMFLGRLILKVELERSPCLLSFRSLQVAPNGRTIGISGHIGRRLRLNRLACKFEWQLQFNQIVSTLSRTSTPSPQSYSNDYRFNRLLEVVKMVSYYPIAGKQVGSHYVGSPSKLLPFQISDFSFIQWEGQRFK